MCAKPLAEGDTEIRLSLNPCVMSWKVMFWDGHSVFSTVLNELQTQTGALDVLRHHLVPMEGILNREQAKPAFSFTLPRKCGVELFSIACKVLTRTQHR